MELSNPLLIHRLSAIARATREQMSAARLPLAYRDSCAHLLIPLNRCRFEEYYLPWKCEVRYLHLLGPASEMRLTLSAVG